MTHILDISHEELERTHRLVENYKPQHIKSMLFSFLPHSFKKQFTLYAEKKESFLLAYKELHTNIHSKKTDILSTEFISHELSHITSLIDECSRLLSTLVAHSHTQEDILLHEKVFFVKLLESFHIDILVWVGTHEKEVFWDIIDQTITEAENPITAKIQLLKSKKQKLESYMKNISKK